MMIMEWEGKSAHACWECNRALLGKYLVDFVSDSTSQRQKRKGVRHAQYRTTPGFCYPKYQMPIGWGFVCVRIATILVYSDWAESEPRFSTALTGLLTGPVWRLALAGVCLPALSLTWQDVDLGSTTPCPSHTKSRNRSSLFPHIPSTLSIVQQFVPFNHLPPLFRSTPPSQLDLIIIQDR
jgi:hypothetical protein